MRLSLPVLLIAASAAVAQKSPTDPAFTRLPGAPLKIADSIRIDVKATKLENPLSLFPGPRGGLVVYSQWSSVTAFDSMGRRIWGNTGVKNDRPRDIAEISAFGWRGNQMWVSDAAFSQIALLDQYGNVDKSIELPSWVRPAFSNRKSFPVFEQMRVLALYDDNTMLVLPRGAVKVTGATDYDEKSSYILKINEDGIIQRTIARFPSNTMQGNRPTGERFQIQNPLNQSLFRVSPDGMRTMVVSVDTMNPKVDSVIVRALNEKGDTVFVQKFPYPTQLLTDAQIDSIGRIQWGNSTEYREMRMKIIPRRSPAVVGLAFDIDKSLWLTLRGDGSTHSVVGIDAAGKYIGKFQIPARRVVKAANLGRVWIGEIRNDSRGDLVRYRLVK